MRFEGIDLKDLSWRVLQFLNNNEPIKSSDAAELLELKPRQVDACVSKSLVRYGFVIRVPQFTRIMKKSYNLIQITPLGKDFVEWRLAKERSEI